MLTFWRKSSRFFSSKVVRYGAGTQAIDMLNLLKNAEGLS
jgi:hypothetical protein